MDVAPEVRVEIEEQEQPNPYRVLGLRKGASAAAIKRAYFKLVRRYSPERYAEEFRRIREAYVSLKSPARRAEVDALLINPPPEPIRYPALAGQPTDMDTLATRIREQKAAGEVDLDLYRQRSLLYVQFEEWEQAQRDWQRILEQAPDDAQTKRNIFLARFLHGNECAEAKDFEQAMRFWRKALRLDPECASLLHNLAIGALRCDWKREQTRYWKKTLEQWRLQLEADPDDDYLRGLVTQAHNQLEHDDDEDQADDHGKEIPLTEDVLNDPEAARNAGVSCLEHKNWRGAVIAFNRCLQHNGDDVEVLNHLGWAYLHIQEEERAFSTWKRALRLQPDNEQTRKNIIQGREQMARQLMDQGLWPMASIHLKHILQLDPKNINARMHLGDAHYHSGDVTSALREWEILLKYHPYHKQTQQRVKEAQSKGRRR